MLSEAGLARSLAQLIEHKLGLKRYKTEKSDYKIIIEDFKSTLSKSQKEKISPKR